MENKRLFLVGSVLGSFFTIAFIVIASMFLVQRNMVKTQDISYNVDVESVVNKAINSASPSVLGVVKFKGDRESGTGSGVVYKLTEENAYIVTNQHVIDSADKIEVAFVNEERVEATLLGEDLLTDLAVIRIPRGNLDGFMEFANSDRLNVGEFVFAIGNPLGLKFYGSATLGIVSSPSRLIPVDVNKDGESDYITNVIQTDAAINPGNSGGALINVDGKLVGINSMKIAGTQIEGLGFAIPSNVVLKIINDLEKYSEVNRPFIGIHTVSMDRLTEANKNKLGLGYLNIGIYINDVTIGSSADRYGLEVNDVITHVNHKEVKDVTDFRMKLYEYKIGDEVTLTVIRDGKSFDIKFDLEAKK